MPAIKPIFGRVSAYGFACGYVETRRGFTLSMQHGTYHLRGINPNTNKSVWEVFRTLKDARYFLASWARKEKIANG